MAKAVAAWERFFFEPQPTSTVAVVRIAFGLLALGWTASLGMDLEAFFSSGAIVTEPDWTSDGRPGWIWGVFDVLPVNDTSVLVVWLVLLAGSICLAVGYGTRLAALVVFLGIMSFERRNPFIFNSGDNLMRVLAFYILLMPAGESLSLDRLRRHRDAFWEFPARAPWALRLMQIQLSVIYLSAVWAKVRGTTWNDGTAVSYALRLDDLERFPVPNAITTSVVASNVLTYGTLAIELAVPILIWVSALRPYVMAAGISLHLGIDYALRVGFFSYAVFVPYLAFLPPQWVADRILGLRDRLTGLHSTPPAVRPAPSAGDPVIPWRTAPNPAPKGERSRSSS